MGVFAASSGPSSWVLPKAPHRQEQREQVPGYLHHPSCKLEVWLAPHPAHFQELASWVFTGSVLGKRRQFSRNFAQAHSPAVPLQRRFAALMEFGLCYNISKLIPQAVSSPVAGNRRGNPFITGGRVECELYFPNSVPGEI